MNKIDKVTSSLLLTLAVLLLCSCQTAPLRGGSGGVGTTSLDYFRIPLGLNDTDTGTWHDVADWQTFMVMMGYLDPASYPKTTFDQNTVTATDRFEVKSGAHNPGIHKVDMATYNKAVAYGMPPCIPTPHP